MAINVQCPHCNVPLSLADEQAGRQVRCPACNNVLTLPGGQAAGQGTGQPGGQPSASPPPAVGPTFPSYSLPPGFVPPPPTPLPPTKTSGAAVATLILCLIPITWPIGIILAAR